MEKLSSLAEAQDDLEIVSIGALYRGHWEKKYWSSSRAKDRYPYPVGYCAIRNHAGTRCQMEIREGPKGPLFLVKLADEEWCSGVTPDLAWKSFQKKNSPKAINWNGRRLSSNIDGSEQFGFKNKVVQRLLRELVANANSTSSGEYKQTLKAHEDVRNQDTSSVSNILVYLRKSKHCGKRGVKCKPEERSAKRMHKEGCTLKDEERPDLHSGSQKEQINEEMEIINGDNDVMVEKPVISLKNHNRTVADIMPSYAENMEGSIRIMSNNPEIGLVQDSLADTDDCRAWKHAQPLPEEISLVDCTPQDAIMKEELRDSMSDVRLSSGSSNLSSQKTDDSEPQEITRSMMAFLLPQAIPLLKKTYCGKSSRKKMQGNNRVESDLATKVKVGGQVEAGDLNKKPDAKIVGPTLADVMQNTNLFPNECKLEPLNTAEVKDVIPDTYDDYNTVNKTDHKMNDTSKPTSLMKEDDKSNYRSDAEIVDHNLLDEMEKENPNLLLNECKHEPLDTSEEARDVIADSFDENNSAMEAGNTTCDASTPTSNKKEDDKHQNDLEKAGILLSDSFLACLEEEFVKIENERVQNDMKIVPLTESITCQHSENTALQENGFAILPLDNKLEVPLGPYLHPQPVLSVTLSSKGDSLEVCVLCGALDSCERTLYVYNVTSQTHPLFVGHTSMLFLSSEEPPVKGNLPLGRVGLQYITEGQLLVLFPSINTPFCSNMSFDCSCLICKLEQGDKNCLKIAHVNFGFVSPVTKLMYQERPTCILVCKPNYIIVFEESARLHVWAMNPNWSAASDEFMLPGCDNMVPSILELREIPRSGSLVLGHNGFGAFCLWDITRQAFLSKFLAPNNITLEILPLSCFSTQKREVSSSNCLRTQLKDIVMDKWNWMQSEDVDVDVAVWLLVSSATVSEFQKDLKATKPNRRWRLALLAKRSLFLGPILDQRISVVDASTDYGFAGTLDGLFYKWELVSGREVSSIQCSESGVSCIAVDHQSGAVAVADDTNQVLIYML